MDRSAVAGYKAWVPNTMPDPAIPLPRAARLPINRCSLPAAILGGLTYQRHPVPLALDGVLELHEGLFRHLDLEADPAARARLFMIHMSATFSLDHPEAAGYSENAAHARIRASYLRMLLGWAFDSDGLEGAVLKGWVESRFGLLPRFHGGPIRDLSGAAYRRYLEQRTRGLYGTNAMEAQFDLLYTYCQYELGRQRPGATHVTLYRGINHLAGHEIMADLGQGRGVVLMNSLVSFSASRERADEFGDQVMVVMVPLAKVFCYPGLLPGLLQGEAEYVVVGGVYEVFRADDAPLHPRESS
ncbi:MAG: NAD(+)--dinitrogen-reductase ADP-D-ribosyltransferase [Gallionellaceae bacterium]|nr:NAD(+)--dinitrogen-reductase ADP-D-ribosyltransferase [Gallionellaceae bacterium]